MISFFCGDKRREELVSILKNNNTIVNEIECYKTLLTPQKIDKNINGIMFFSPTGIQSFLLENNPENKIAFCIGDTTATKAKEHFKTVLVSRTATIDGVIEAVNQYYKIK